MIQKMSHLEKFLEDLYKILTGKTDLNNNIIRKHTRKLDQLGDLSFPINTTNWYHLLEHRDQFKTILEYSSELNKSQIDFESLIIISLNWEFPIEKCVDIKDNCHVFLQKSNVYRTILREVRDKKELYGTFKLCRNVQIFCEKTETNKSKQNLTDLRLTILKNVMDNFLDRSGCDFEVKNGFESIILSTKSSDIKVHERVIVCGSVLNSKGTKDNETTSENYYRQRTEDMRMMAEHKYGMRVTSKPGWKEFFEKLGHAAVVIELLQNKITSTAVVDMNNHFAKNASFILYNCARLSALFKEFDLRVAQNIYPKLPDLNEIDFTLLNQPEEWELLYVYVLQYPLTIKSCIKDVLECKVNVHNLVSMLTSLASLFSAYYRRVKILREAKSHLFGVLHARIYLLKAVEQVFHNALKLLNITPVKQM